MSHASLSRLVALALLALLAQGALGQSPPAGEDPRQMDDAQRRAYAATLREAKDLIDHRHFAEATAKLDALIATRPREPQARFLKGVALTDAGSTEEAIATFRALLAEYPELPEPRNNLAVLYAQKGEYAQARDELERAVQAAPDYAVAHENLGDVYARLAEVEYEKTLALDKRNAAVGAKLKMLREVPAGKKPPAPASATGSPTSPTPSKAQ
jgi:Flp pilus assembly protein TadD